MGIGLTEEEYVAETAWDYQEGRISKLEAELAELREALQKIADGKDNLGWSPCAHIAKAALLKQGGK